MEKKTLFNFEFLSLCMITFLALCNVAAFYNFHLYLQDLGFLGKQAGFLIGLYSLTAMALYLFASKHISINNAMLCVFSGIVLVVCCGFAYLFVENFWLLGLVRIANGTGVFLVMASTMVMLIAIIPSQKIGMAFSLYSVALLLPYSIMPAVSDVIRPYVDKPTFVYLGTALLLLPAIKIISNIRNRIKLQQSDQDAGTDKVSSQVAFDNGERRRNLMRKPVISILIVNAIYFTIFTALFYLFEGFALQRGIKNTGLFFSTQMGVMIAIRLVGGRIFDTVSKFVLVIIALLGTGAGFGLLLLARDPVWILPIAVVFGMAMGLCVPPLNSLMYLVSQPKYRGYNSNIMMLSIHFGSFMGPFAGGWIIDAGGYDIFLTCAIFITVGAAALFFFLNPEKDVQHISVTL